MKKVNEYDFSFQLDESFEEAIEGLKNIKSYLNSSLNGTIENIGDVEINIEPERIQMRFWLEDSIIIEDYTSWDHEIDSFIDWTEGNDYELQHYKTLKETLLRQVKKLDAQIKKVELS